MDPESASVLVVEDEPSVRALVQDVLAGEGYDVYDASGGWEALGLFEDHEIRLLLTDIVMPEMSGRELARRVESIRPETKILYMSASLIDDVLDPDDHFIAKPFAVDHILHTVQEVLAQ